MTGNKENPRERFDALAPMYPGGLLNDEERKWVEEYAAKNSGAQKTLMEHVAVFNLMRDASSPSSQPDDAAWNTMLENVQTGIEVDQVLNDAKITPKAVVIPRQQIPFWKKLSAMAALVFIGFFGFQLWQSFQKSSTYDDNITPPIKTELADGEIHTLWKNYNPKLQASDRGKLLDASRTIFEPEFLKSQVKSMPIFPKKAFVNLDELEKNHILALPVRVENGDLCNYMILIGDDLIQNTREE